MKRAMAAVLLVLLSLLVHSNAEEEAFDVRHHLSTVSRYGVVKGIADSSFVPSKIPNGCTPIHLNLVARHGTRSPTKKRIKELDNLATHLEVLLREAEEQNLALETLPGWLKGWKSPWKGKLKGGELIIQGEDELYDLGIRTRARFPNLFNDDYHPDVYAIRATQVPRPSASAVAFGMGLFSGKGSLGPGCHRAFAVTSESRASDTKLRFHDCCQNYKAFKKSQEPAVDKLKEPVYDEITSALRRRYRLNFTRQDTTSLWFLCKQEVSLLNKVDQACALFSPSEGTSKVRGIMINMPEKNEICKSAEAFSRMKNLRYLINLNASLIGNIDLPNELRFAKLVQISFTIPTVQFSTRETRCLKDAFKQHIAVQEGLH